MNKTVNMNLGGFFFHIDEDAYQKLNRYFDAIRASLSKEGRDEIMNDIESRVSELFSEKLTNSKQVLSLKDVDDVIAIMGQPEDYKIEDDASANANYAYGASGRTKKLYRDKETGIVAGVCTGLGHYFGIDPVWIRIALVVLFFASGTGLLAYIIMWAIVPEAVSTSEKLEMKGEPINISNIEKKVKEEFESVSDKFKNADYTQMGENVRTGAQRVGSSLGDIIITIMKVFAKFIGALMVFISAISLIAVIIASVVMVFSSSLSENTAFNNITTPLGIETPYWIQGVLFLIVAGIPLFFMLILGLKILVNNLKSIGNTIKYSLLAVWLIALGIAITLGFKEANQIAIDGKIVEKRNIPITSNDTLKVKFVYNDFFAKDVEDKNYISIKQDSTGHEVIYSNHVSLHLKSTDKSYPYIQIERKSVGSNYKEANERAEKIRYNFKIVNNELILDNYFLTDSKNKLRDQEVEIYLYLPNGIVYYPDSSVTNYLDGDNADFDYYYGPEGYKYKVENSELKCLNCPEEDNDSNDENTSVIINENGVQIKKDTTISNSKEIKELKISEDGIIIKTK